MVHIVHLTRVPNFHITMVHIVHLTSLIGISSQLILARLYSDTGMVTVLLDIVKVKCWSNLELWKITARRCLGKISGNLEESYVTARCL